MNWPKSPILAEEWHRGPLIRPGSEEYEVDKMAMLFILAERERVFQEFHEGIEAAERALKGDRRVRTVDHEPCREPCAEDVLAARADEVFSALPDEQRYKLSQNKLLRKYREAA